MADLLPLPALRTHGVVAVIDDDADFVHMLVDLLHQQDCTTVPFTRPAVLHSYLAPRVDALSDEQRLLAEIWRAQVDVSGTVVERALQFFARPERLNTTLVLVSDYAMPDETGVALCSRLEYGALERVLLTGVADTSVAVTAFNAGAIDQFVQKQGAKFPQNVIAAVENCLDASAKRRAAPLTSALSAELAAALKDPAVSAALRALLRETDVREYMMLGQPQGVLGITGVGSALWIQLETAESLQALDEVLESTKDLQRVRKRVRDHAALVAPDFMKQLGAAPTEQSARVLSHEPLVLAAVHPLTLPPELAPMTATRPR